MSHSHKTLEERIARSIELLKEDLNTVRAGRANAAMLDKVSVEYYGMATPLKNLANISVPEPRTLLISPFDPKSISGIEKAINIANIGINPIDDGVSIRLNFPAPTEERRKALAKDVSKMAEEAKVGIRNIRRNANDDAKKLKDEGVSEDEVKLLTDKIQEITDKYVKKIDELCDLKVKDILTV